MTRMFYPPELEHSRERDRFDPVREGERYGLSLELSLAIWKQASEDATDTFGRRNEDKARERFHEFAVRIAARGGRLRPDPGRLTRVGVEIGREPMGTWAVDELMPRVPGRQTLAAVEARRWANRAGDVSMAREPSGLSSGGGGNLPENVRTKMESAFCADFSSVQIHQGGEAEKLGALAYTQGTNIYFAPGQYDPHSQAGQELLGHELTHVVQQAQGRVLTSIHVRGAPVNNDPALESEADALGARAARGESVAAYVGAAPAIRAGAPVQAKMDSAGGGETPAADFMVSAEEDAASPAQGKGFVAPVQASGLGPIQRQTKKQTFVPHQITITEQLTVEQFRAVAMKQIFGGNPPKVEWHNTRETYEPGTYQVDVESSLLRRGRSDVARSKGIDVGEDGGIVGADKRAKEFSDQPASDAKNAVMNEIDRRYYEASGTNTKIKPGEQGKAALWFQIRDEVLFQQQYIANLPPKVKQLIKVSVKGRELTPADYEQLFRITKSIENMPPGRVADYESKVTGTGTDLDQFEASVQKYAAEMAARDKQGEEREAIKTKLNGLEDLYKKYRSYLSSLKTEASAAGAGMVGGPVVLPGTPTASSMYREELERELPRYGFASISDFEAFIKKFEQAFELEAVNIAKDVMAKYGGRLYKESERYSDPAQIASVYQRLGNYRAQYVEFEKNAKISNDYVQDSERSRLPGNGHLRPTIGPDEAKAAYDKAAAAKAAAEGEFQAVAADHFILQEDKLPNNPIDKASLARASEAELGALLKARVATAQKELGEARDQLEGKPSLIYKMDKLMPQFYAQMGIAPDSIYDLIIRDKMKDDAIVKLVLGIVGAVIAIALAIISAGAATPAIATAAAVAGFGLSAVQAYQEYQEYTESKDLADVGLANDPSVVWLVIALIGAGIDAAAVAKAMKGAKGFAAVAKAVEEGGNVDDFVKAVKDLEKAGELEANISRAAQNAADARKAFGESTNELMKALGKAYSLPGPFTDPEVYKALVKMARDGLKTSFHTIEKWIEELKLLRVKAKLPPMTPEELTKAKEAWTEAQAAAKAEQAAFEKLLPEFGNDAAKLTGLIAKVGDAATLERLLKSFPASELETIVGHLSDPKRLIYVLEHVDPKSAPELIRKFIADGKISQLNQFVDRLASGVGKELAETAAVKANSIIIDSNTAIALAKDADPALRATLQPGEKAWVAHIKSLPPGTELRVGNVTIGEVGSGAIANVKGLPLDIARDSAEYQKVLTKLTAEKVGAGKGIADRALVTDAFFAKTEAGVTAKFMTGDQNAVKKLAGIAGKDVVREGGFPGLVAKYGTTGFDVTVEGRTITVIPLKGVK